VLGVAVVLLRVGGDPLEFVWAEDGGIFLRGAFNDSIPGALTETYAGYLHAVPRLLAEPAAALPLEWSSKVLALAAAAVTVLCAFIVWRASQAHLPDPLLRGFLSAMVLLSPVVGFESLANVTNLQWMMFFAAFWLLLWHPGNLSVAVAAGVFLALTLASAPLALLLAPLAALRIREALRDRCEAAIVAGFGVGAIVQLIAIFFDDSQQADPRWDFDLLPAYLVRVVGGLGFGQNAGSGLWEVVPGPVLAMTGLAFAAIVIAVLRPTPARGLSLLALALSAGLFLIPGYLRDAAEPLMWTDEYTGTYGARYVILPALFLLTAVLLQLQAASSRVRIPVLAVILAAALTTFYVGDPGRSTVRWTDTVEAARETCAPGQAVSDEVPVSWPDWRIYIPCSRL
jgi:hypothetical protein